jgi:excisionase family DNA binding protein
MSVTTTKYPVLSAFEGRLTISVEEVAEVLGISRSSAYEAVRTGQLPSRRLGRRIVVPIPLLLDWLGLSHDGELRFNSGSRCRRVR